jgi:hypothetical protein
MRDEPWQQTPLVLLYFHAGAARVPPYEQSQSTEFLQLVNPQLVLLLRDRHAYQQHHLCICMLSRCF